MPVLDDGAAKVATAVSSAEMASRRTRCARVAASTVEGFDVIEVTFGDESTGRAMPGG